MEQVNSYQAVVYDDYTGLPLKVTFVGEQWWVTTPAEPLQPLKDYFGNDDDDDAANFRFLCEADEKVGAQALAKMLGVALTNPEDEVDKTLRQRVKSLKRLGVKFNTQDETLELKMELFENPDGTKRQGKYSVVCYLSDNCFDTLFDIDGFRKKSDALEWVGYYLEMLEDLGIAYIIQKNNSNGTD